MDGGWGMYPTSVFGLLLIGAGLLFFFRPEARFIPLVVCTGVLTLAAGVLGAPPVELLWKPEPIHEEHSFEGCGAPLLVRSPFCRRALARQVWQGLYRGERPWTDRDGWSVREGEAHLPGSRKIDGFWVQCGVDEYGPTGHYALMVDQHAARSRVLFGSVAGLGPLVVLAERLAVRLHVPCDTRGSDFR